MQEEGGDQETPLPVPPVTISSSDPDDAPTIPAINLISRPMERSRNRPSGHLWLFKTRGQGRQTSVAPHPVTRQELAQHNTLEDCWSAYDGNVYDITPFLQYHPGGAEMLEKFAGKDMTTSFNGCHRHVNGEMYMGCLLIGPLVKRQRW